jgi:hypothetical protein
VEEGVVIKETGRRGATPQLSVAAVTLTPLGVIVLVVVLTPLELVVVVVVNISMGDCSVSGKVWEYGGCRRTN